jgi:hypothetical protein
MGKNKTHWFTDQALKDLDETQKLTGKSAGAIIQEGIKLVKENAQKQIKNPPTR